MRRIAILTAGGDTPALNATIYGAVERANERRVEVIGIVKGFGGMLDPGFPHLTLNPLYTTIPELEPSRGGTILGASRTYISADDTEHLHQVAARFKQLGIDGLVCIGGDGTINGMQPLSELFPCVLAPKTIDNDLGLNYIDEPNEWIKKTPADGGKSYYEKLPGHTDIELDNIINYATPGYATAVFVAAQSIQRIRTTAESHRRIAIVEVMGRESGYIALGSAYGQPDMILIPEVPVNVQSLETRVRELYELQKHAVIVVGEGVVDEKGERLGAKSSSFDPAGNTIYSGAAEQLTEMLKGAFTDKYFRDLRRHDSANAAIFTRKVGHTQRGGRPIRFDRFYASQLGGKAVDLLLEGANNSIATLQWSENSGFELDSIPANKLRDRWGKIRARTVHPSLYDPLRFRPSRLGIEYLFSIFGDAIGDDDLEHMRTDLFSPGNLVTRYQSVNVDVRKRIRFL